MLRLSILAAALVSIAATAQAQISNPKPFIEVTLGALTPAESVEDTLTYKQTVEFDTGFAGGAEIGAKVDMSGQATGIGLVGINYGTSNFDFREDASSGLNYTTNDNEVNASITSYYVGAGLEYALSPKMNIGGTMKVGGSSINIEAFDETEYDSADEISTPSAEVTSEDNSGFMWGPELNLSFSVNEQIDLVGKANAQFHYIDSDAIAADSLTTYYVGGGLRFNLR